ncbi:hypothetical protein ACP4OV_027943 [Aristida adscensionis]
MRRIKYNIVNTTSGDTYFYVEFSELYQLYHADAIDKTLMSCCMEHFKFKEQGISKVGFVDPCVVNQPMVDQYPTETEENLYKALKEQMYCTDILLPYNFDWGKAVYDSKARTQERYQPLVDMLNKVLGRIGKKYKHIPKPYKHTFNVNCVKYTVRQEDGTNTCAFHVFQWIHNLTKTANSQKDPSGNNKEFSSVQILALQEQLAGFLLEQCFTSGGECHMPLPRLGIVLQSQGTPTKKSKI